MCCFSTQVQVSDTRIFARPSGAERQFLVYSMTMEAAREGAMVLPLPTPAGSPEDAVRFLDLEKYPQFFADLKKAFPAPRARQAGPASGAALGAKPQQNLAVVQVGAFEASFVPTVADFARLDPRFRLPEDSWAALDSCADWGFAVFKLKAGRQDVHPMAFEFPRRDPTTLFFPTVHIHDGKVHPKADFDHELYCQPGPLRLRELLQWRESPAPLASTSKIDRALGILDGEQHAYLRRVKGLLKNEDVVLRQQV